MALINRISRLFKADFHAVLDQIEEPEQLLKQAIRDMEDDLASSEQRVALCAHEQTSLSLRQTELQDAIAEIDVQLDLCFESGKDNLAKNQIKKKLEAERLLKGLSTRHTANERQLCEQKKRIDENQKALESLRQKAELFARRAPESSGNDAQFNDIAWMTREMAIDDDEVEIAYLREKNQRKAS